MPHDFRYERFRGRDFERDERRRAGSQRGRFGGAQSYSPSWDDPNAARRVEGDRSYEAGDYSNRGRGAREFGRDDDYGDRGYRGEGRWNPSSRERSEDWRSRRDAEDQRGWYGGSAEPGEPWRTRGRGTGLMRWDDRANGTGDYFGTGSYYGAYGTQPSAHASGSAYGDRGYLGANEERWDELREGRDEDRNRERFAEQRYGRDPQFGYGFAQEGTQGTFRGRGPKGYERSDERLREMICERLTDDPRVDASDVQVEVQDKIVKLTGFVSDRRSKYEIEDVVEHCGGVKDIDNQLRVRKAGMTQSSGSHIASGESAGDSRGGARGASTPKRTS